MTRLRAGVGLLCVEIEKLLEAAHGRVRETLTGKRDLLTSLAKMLIEKEVVDADTLERPVKGSRNEAAYGA